MKQIVNTAKVTEISISDLISKGLESSMIIYYLTNNDSYPCFLKPLPDNTYGFVSPVLNNSPVFVNKSVRECLDIATKSRKVYVINKDEWISIFKTI